MILFNYNMGLTDELDGFYAAIVESECAYIRESSKGVSYSSIIYMDLIWSNRGCTVGRLAGILGIDKSAVSRKVDSMVRQGLIVKGSDGEDGRTRPLRLSDRWQEIYDRSDAPFRRAVATMEERMSEDELRTVCKAFRMMSEELRRGWE